MSRFAGVSEAGVPITRCWRGGVEEREPAGEIPSGARDLGNSGVLEKVVRPERIELPTSWFVAKHSIQLSYGRVMAILCV